MARILGAIASSHTPTIGFALDRRKQDDPVWAPIFAAYEPIQRWLAEKKPDVLFFVYNDHVTSFFFDHYSAFALGIGESFAVADEGGGAARAAAGAGRPGAGRAHRQRADGGGVRPVRLPAARARPRLLLAAVDDAPARGRLALPAGAAAGGRAAVPDSHRAPLLSARPGAAPRDRELSRGHRRGDRRHRRALAPGARRARRIQRSGMGCAVHGPARGGPGSAGGDDARRATRRAAASRAPR